MIILTPRDINFHKIKNNLTHILIYKTIIWVWFSRWTVLNLTFIVIFVPKHFVNNLNFYMNLVYSFIQAKSNMVYYIDGTKNNGDWVFSDNTIIPSSALVWAKGEPHADKCLSLFNSNFMHGDTICSGHADGFNFGFVCERVI